MLEAECKTIYRTLNKDASYLKRLYKGPEQNSDSVTLSQKLYEPGRSEQLEKAHVYGVDRLQETRGRLCLCARESLKTFYFRSKPFGCFSSFIFLVFLSPMLSNFPHSLCCIT